MQTREKPPHSATPFLTLRESQKSKNLEIPGVTNTEIILLSSNKSNSQLRLKEMRNTQMIVEKIVLIF